MVTPKAVLEVLDKLDADDRATVHAYISKLEAKVSMGGTEEVEMVEEDDAPKEKEDTNASPSAQDDDDDDFPPIYASGEDYDKAADFKQQAADAKSNQDWSTALDLYTKAVLAAPPSALLYANRANSLLKLGRFRAAIRDCDLALQENPDSAKALRMRGKARKELGDYEGALKDLSASQTIDFDEGTVEDLKFLTEKRVELEKEEARIRNEEEEKLRKRAEEIRKAQEEAKREAEEAATSEGMPGGMPGGFPGGMPGGFPGGMPGGIPPPGLFSDPELMAAMQNPKVLDALQQVMGSGGVPDPSKIQELMSDPEVGPILQKVMSKMGGGMGTPGAGAPPAGGDDDIPNLDDLGGEVDLDDLPDLE